jgi:SAM-dependent methyltransferase/uncharacterized protein YbaR (Trm112 family)
VRFELLHYLACPACAGDLAPSIIDASGSHIISGTLTCAGCESRYEIRGGVPRLNEAMAGLEQVAHAFSFEWKAHLTGQLEHETVFGRTHEEEWQYFKEGTGFDDSDLSGAVVLDAGCGPAQVTRQMAEHGARVAIGMDMNEAVDEAFRACRDLPNVHIVQGNVFAPPFKTKQFDLVWSNGVIHHTPDAPGAHRSLSRYVKPGGTLYVWVYAARWNPFRFTRDVLDFLHVTRLPEHTLLRIAKVFSYASLGLLRVYQLVRRLPGLRPRSRWGERSVRGRTLKELELTWLDTLSPEYDSRHSEAEVIGWFERLGFKDIRAIEEPKVGVRGVAPSGQSLTASG